MSEEQMRAEFEDWWRRTLLIKHELTIVEINTYCKRSPEGYYVHAATAMRWEGWKAAIASKWIAELEKEIARLDFVLKESAFIMKSETDTKQTVYQLWAQDEDEYFWSLCGNTFHKTPRLAIDCAMQTPEEARTKVEF